MADMDYSANPGKTLSKEIDGQAFVRIPIKTHLIGPYENLAGVVKSYVWDHVQEGDTVIISEKIVAIAQGRVLPVEHIEPSPLAAFFGAFCP